MTSSEGKTDSITINGVTYKTAGNILFASEKEGDYLLAESTLLNKLDEVAKKDFLENGMHSLLKRFKG